MLLLWYNSFQFISDTKKEGVQMTLLSIGSFSMIYSERVAILTMWHSSVWQKHILVRNNCCRRRACGLFSGNAGCKNVNCRATYGYGVIWAMIFAIVFARLYYVIFDPDHHFKTIADIFRISDGGLAIYGGIIGGVLRTFYLQQNTQAKAESAF